MLVPKLRFKEFSDEWEKRKISNVLKIKSGRDQKAVECLDGNYPILGTGGQIGKTNSFLYDKPSVLIGRKGTINKPQYMNSPFWTVDTLFYSEIFEPNIPKYIYYLFQKTNWSKHDESTGVPSLSCKIIENLNCYIPSKLEQTKIADFLSLIDKKIELQTKKIEILKLYKKGTFPIVFQNDLLKRVILRDISIILKGQQINNENLLDNGKYYMLNGGIRPSGFLNEYNTDSNTISISEGGNSCGYVNFNIEPFWSGGHCYTLKPKAINNKYLYQLLKFNEKKIMNLRVGSGLPNIQKQSLESFSCKIHPKEEQKEISKVFFNIDNKIFLEELKLKKLHNLKSGLMQNMFV